MTVRFLTRFSQRPLHVLGAVGLCCSCSAASGWSTWPCSGSSDHGPIGNRPLLVYSAALLGVGTQLISLGILAELVTSYNIRAEDTYSIAETVERRARPPRRPRR